MSEKPAARTLFASKAMELSDMFAIKFASKAFNGSPRRMVKLKPPAESTGGGAQAREAIILVQAGQEGYAGLMCGWANAAEKRAELRSYATIAAQHQAKTKSKLDLNANEYQEFLAEAQTFFQQEGFVVETVKEVSASFAAAPAPMKSGSSSKVPLMILFMIVALAIGLGAGWLLFK